MTKKNNLSKLEFKNEGSNVEISIYGVVDAADISAKNIKDTLDAANPENITLRINSVGGDVQEGIAIGNIIKSYGVPSIAYIDSLCASIATVIAVSCDKVVMADNASFMIHNPSTMLMDVATSDDLRKIAEALDSMKKSIAQSYLSRGLKIDEKKLIELMDAETWMTADEALEYGFIDEISNPVKAVACATRKMLDVFRNAPDDVPTQKEPEDPDNPKEPEEGKTLDDLMQQLFDIVDEIKKQYKPEKEPEPEPKDPDNPDDPQQGVENIFKAFFNTTQK
ncbi:Clp protease ClpP [Latilactobacillus sakei]|uniref:head maturation protease, ClpP-related n=1 Tax=Latilactobacillus sakei TaxID=1599 RepID=UPI0020C7E236|nr:head maturation protease, ClpP-related [Latilactobacillus sakei]MCP8855933.1 Clp protease ClpP [Latilactobacillus sakei]